MEYFKKYSYDIDNKKLDLTITNGANPNGLYAIIIIVQEGPAYIGSVRFTISWIDLLKKLDSWDPFYNAAYELFIHKNCAKRLFQLKQVSTKNCDIEEEFKFIK